MTGNAKGRENRSTGPCRDPMFSGRFGLDGLFQERNEFFDSWGEYLVFLVDDR